MSVSELSLRDRYKDLRQAYSEHEILSDIGSGICIKPRNFQRFLEQAFSGNIEEVIVAHMHRL
jgi:predicted site-specific integrase-resolvase